MAEKSLIELSGIGIAVWQQYKASGDFAVFLPNNAEADGGGMFHVKLSDWNVIEELPSDKTASATVKVRLRRKGVDDQGRTA